MAKVDDKREAILQATLRLVAEHGFHGTAMSKVAKEAHVSAGIIYHYFANKDELIIDLYKTIKQRSANEHISKLDSSQPLRAQVRELWGNVIRYFINNSQETMFISQFLMSPYMTPEIEEEVAPYYRPLMDLFEEATKELIIKPLPQPIFAVFALDVPSALVSRQASGQIELTDEMVDIVIESMWQAIRL